MATLTELEIEKMGFKSVGQNLIISDRASFHNCANIAIGNNVRIDDFCVLSAGKDGIIINDFVHIAVFSSLIGAGKISISNFCNISSRVAIYSSSDNYTGVTMTNPMVSVKYTGVTHAPVHLAKHVIIGSGSIILPGVVLEEGVAIGALSLVTKTCRAFGIFAGVPAKYLKDRSRDLLELEKAFLAERGI